MSDEFPKPTGDCITDRMRQRAAEAKRQAHSSAPAGSPFPFECDNCGNKPTPKEVLDHKGDCANCGDTVITYTVDAAEWMLRVMENEKLTA